MEALAAALFTTALAVIGKVAFDFWQKFQERRATAAALAGEIGAYFSLLDPQTAAPNFRAIARLDIASRRVRLRGFPPLPTGHPVFDKVAGRLGLLPTKEALDVSAIYNVVTGIRLVMVNFSSKNFIEADDEFQKATLEFVATSIESTAPWLRPLWGVWGQSLTTAFGFSQSPLFKKQ